MFDREDIIGFVLLGLCLAVGGVLVYGIVTGNHIRYTGPGWLGVVLLVLFIGASLYGLANAFGRWPDPFAGRRPWWRRRKDGEER